MIAGAKKGDIIAVRLSDNTVKLIILEEIKTFGIEGYNKYISNQPLTFFPFHNIISISKNN